ncbi:MAG: AAA family ATPase [Ignavibacteriales bacterium]|nr:AAA family ATPase [Ignavibacteriales bacterium]
MLAIEEPEAHLHPSLQYKFLRFLDNNLNKQKQARQIFITTHSTHITSAISLDSIICLYEDYKRKNRVGYVGKAFGKNIESKNYVKRFLDATKSNMLFADRIIFVEGLAEQILLPCIASYEEIEEETTKEDLLINKHVSIISVDSRTFKHFLILFGYNETSNNYAIGKKVVCITDADPMIKKGNRWHATYPFLLDGSDESKNLSSHVFELNDKFQSLYPNIKICHPDAGKGKTFEYELAKYNPTSRLLITNSFTSQSSPHSIKNYLELVKKYNSPLDELINEYSLKLGTEVENDEVVNGIKNCNWDENEKKNAFFAAIYLRSISKSKGENSLFLEKKLRDNLKVRKPRPFVIPNYIKDAISFVLD